MCEFAYKDNRYQFLLCRKMNQDGLDSAEKAAKSMCMFQRFCALTKKYENTDSASRCLIKQQRREELWLVFGKPSSLR